jgi:hypothetical protein
MTLLAVLLTTVATAAPVTSDVFGPPTGFVVACPGAPAETFKVRGEVQAPADTACSVTSGSDGPGTIVVGAGAVWSCEAVDAVLQCTRTDVPTVAAEAPAPRTAPRGTPPVVAPASRVPHHLSAQPANMRSALAEFASLPSPGGAAALSGTVGFGAGHFYANNRGAGVAYLLLEGAFVGVTAAGALADDPDTAEVLSLGGALGLGVSRIADTVTAARAAHRNAAAHYNGE